MTQIVQEVLEYKKNEFEVNEEESKFSISDHEEDFVLPDFDELSSLDDNETYRSFLSFIS